MREVGRMEAESPARRFASFLFTEGIPCDVERTAGEWTVWVHDDDHVGRAVALLESFRVAPDDPRYAGAVAEAGRRRRADARARQRSRVAYVDSRTIVYRRTLLGPTVLTFLLAGACVAVAFRTRLGEDAAAVRPLQISAAEPDFLPDGAAGAARARLRALPEIRRGEAWRL